MGDLVSNNCLIAQFMGEKIENGQVYASSNMISSFGVSYPCSVNDLLYHSSWDWLMPVVEKIEDTSLPGFPKYGHHFQITNWNVIIKDILSGVVRCSINLSSMKILSKIEAVYLAVVQFIKWYNLEIEK